MGCTIIATISNETTVPDFQTEEKYTLDSDEVFRGYEGLASRVDNQLTALKILLRTCSRYESYIGPDPVLNVDGLV